MSAAGCFVRTAVCPESCRNHALWRCSRSRAESTDALISGAVLSEREQHAGALVAQHASIPAQQVLVEFAVVLEPPEGRPRNQQVADALRAHVLEMRDRGSAVGRM